MKDKNHTQLLHIYWTFATNKNYATVITSYRTFFLRRKKNGLSCIISIPCPMVHCHLDLGFLIGTTSVKQGVPLLNPIGHYHNFRILGSTRTHDLLALGIGLNGCILQHHCWYKTIVAAVRATLTCHYPESIASNGCQIHSKPNAWGIKKFHQSGA